MNKNLKERNINSSGDIKKTNILSMEIDENQVDPEIDPKRFLREFIPNLSFTRTYVKMGQPRLNTKTTKDTSEEQFEIIKDVGGGTVSYSVDKNDAIILIADFFGKKKAFPKKLNKVLLYIIKEMGTIHQSKWKHGEISDKDRELRFPVSRFIASTSFKPNNTESSRYYFSGVIRNALDYLVDTSIDMLKYTKNKKNRGLYYDKLSMFERIRVYNGEVIVTVTPTFMDYFIREYQVMDFPFSIVMKMRGDAPLEAMFYISNQRKLHGRTKKDENGNTVFIRRNSPIKLGVGRLIKSIGEIPLYENLKQKRIRKKIIDPFEKVMNEIKNTPGTGVCNWRYWKKNGEKICKEDFEKYKAYESLYVIVEFDDSDQHAVPIHRITRGLSYG
jgi:hypothetical protein